MKDQIKGVVLDLLYNSSYQSIQFNKIHKLSSTDMKFSAKILANPTYGQADIVTKYKKYPEFKKQLDQIESYYHHDLNIALYTSLEEQQISKVFDLIEGPTLYVAFYSYKMSYEESLAGKYYHLWIRLLDQKLRQYEGRKYSIIYYHCLSDSIYPYNFLRGIFKKLPVYYYAMLDKIFVVESTFMLRNTVGLFDFGRLNKLYNRKVQFVQNIIQLSKIPEIQKNNVLKTLPSLLREELVDKNNKKKVKQEIERYRQSTIVAHQQSLTKKSCLTVKLNQHKANSDGIPIFLVVLLETLRNHPSYLDMEGIFRKNGNTEEQEKIIEQLSKIKKVQPIKNIDNNSGYQIAGVVKKIFTKLEQPIVPYEVYNKLLKYVSDKTISPQEQVDFVRGFLKDLPSINRIVLLYLLDFLKNSLITHKQQNKMTNYNTSVCFCPCIFRSQTPSLSDLLYSGKFVAILNIFFNHYEEIIGKQKQIKQRKSKEDGGIKSQLQKSQKNNIKI